MNSFNLNKSCLKPPRNFRVHPEKTETECSKLESNPKESSNKWPSSSISTSSAPELSQPFNYRSSFHNLSKRFKNRSKIAIETENSKIDCRNGLDAKLQNPEIFASISELQSFPKTASFSLSKIPVRSSQQSLKSCLKKPKPPASTFNKFLYNCDKNVNAARNLNPSCQRRINSTSACGFRKFLTVTTIIIYMLVLMKGTESVLIGEKEQLIQNLWDELTEDEIISIFGRKHVPNNLQNVPNFDLVNIQPHGANRWKRSISPTWTKFRIQGLGRHFKIHLNKPNGNNLIDQDFVFLKRGENRTEILSHSHVTKELPCYFHGIAEHSSAREKDKERMRSKIAVNVCDGMRGLILPSSTGTGDSNDHHYVIHPVPFRLHRKYGKASSMQNSTMGLDDHPLQRNHFLFKVNMNDKNDESERTSCAHDAGSNKGVNKRRRKRSPDGRRDPFDSYWFHQYHQQRSFLNNPPFYTSPSSSSSAFPSSFWGTPEKKDGFFNPGFTSTGSIGFTQSNPNYYEVYDDEDRETSPSSANRRVLLYNSDNYNNKAPTSEEEEPDTILPYYIKGGRRKSDRNRANSKILKSKQNYWIPSSGERYYRVGGGGANSTDKPGTFSSKFRKGRRDDELFGTEYKSELDLDRNPFLSSEKETPNPNRILMEKTPRPRLRAEEDEGRKVPPAHLTIETAVFVDKDLYSHMESNFPEDTHGEVVRIVLAMINAVQLLYQDPSLGHRVDFVLKRLEVLESDPPGLIRPYDIDRFLTNFCKWQKTENPVSDADPLHWDHALILTGLDLYVVHQSGKISNQVVGLAPVAGMCTRSSSCTVNEGRHFESVFVISHEIGHNLGMRHDGPQADNDCDPTSHIMSPTLGSGKITWSPCSKKYLDMFLETSQSKCLLDKAKSEIRLDHDADGRLPGERFDADRQCILKYGRGSYHATQQPMEDVCRDLHCRREHYTWTSHPALEGTFCGPDMWCRSGKCMKKSSGPGTLPGDNYYYNNGNSDNGLISSNNHLGSGETAAYSVQKAVDGAWGQWSLFTDCSSACLHSDDGSLELGSTGIRLAARRCDSPRPENGGRQCSGPDRRYKTCPASKVSKICSSVGRTTVSQYANDVCARAARVDNELTGIGFMMRTSNDAERACSVWCETLDRGVPRSRGWSFPDGTQCKLGTMQSQAKTPSSYCVAGKCQDFTCNPYSHYALSDEECTFTAANEVTPQSSWYTKSTLGSDSVGRFDHDLRKERGQGQGSESQIRGNDNDVVESWNQWEIQSECKLSCLAPAKGLELVRRRCVGAEQCSGLSLSVRLCKPDKVSISKSSCTRLQTPFEYATKVCTKYAEKIQGLSGIGMQLAATKEDKDRPCRIGCQDVSIPYRFYMVNGEDGWFPAGTDCARGDPDKKAFCIMGKCVDFGNDDTPLYKVNTKLLGRLESLFQVRRKREASAYNILEPLKVPERLSEASLRELVHKFEKDTGNFPSLPASYNSPFDFNKPVITRNFDRNGIIRSRSSSRSLIPQARDSPNSHFSSRLGENFRDPIRTHKPRNIDYREPENDPMKMESTAFRAALDNSLSGFGNGALEGSFYEWRKIVSDCSVSCGKGIQEVIVQCVSGDTVVSDALCSEFKRPGFSGYVDCHPGACASQRKSPDSGGGQVWNWLQSFYHKNSTGGLHLQYS